MVVGNVQLGKAGITDNFIGTIKNGFKNHDSIRVSVLKSLTRDRDEMKKLGEEICQKLGDPKFGFKFKKIGFILVLKRFRKKK